MTKTRMSMIGLALFAAIAGCGRDDKRMDDALQNDLSLAAQQAPANLDSISAVERGYGYTSGGTAANAPTSRAATTTRRTSTSTARRSSSTGSRTASAPATREVTVKNTKRDAAIGAAAGAVIGATTSKDKLKGAVIGAAAGGILGAVIGNNVDVKKKRVPANP